MANYITDPVTGIKIPIVGVDPGEDYAVNISDALGTLAHLTHTGAANQDGYQIPAAGLNIDDDVSIQNNNLNDLRSTQFTSQGSPLSGVGDLNCVYVKSGDLFYNNASGTPVQITSGSNLDVAVPVNLIQIGVAGNLTIPSTASYNSLNVGTSGGTYTITLPLSTDTAGGRFFYIKDVDGNAQTNNITIRVESPDVLDGASSATLTSNYEACLIVGNGAGYWSLFPFDKTSYNAGETLTFNADGYLNMNPGSGITLTGGATLGTLCLLTLDGYAAMLVTNNCGIALESGANLTILSGADQFVYGITHIATSGSNHGELRIQSGAAENVDSGGQLNINTGGELNVNSSGEINVVSGGQIAFASGGLLTGIATVNNNSQIILTDTAQLNLDGTDNIININGTSTLNNLGNTVNANWPSFAVTQSRVLINPIIDGQALTASAWTVINGFTINSTTTGCEWAVPLTRTHDQATLSSVTIGFKVGATHSGGISGIVFPNLSIQACNINTGAILKLSTTDPQYFPTPASGSAWYDSNNYQTLTYTCNQHNLINNQLYSYSLVLVDENGGSALGNNLWYPIQLNFTLITTQAWSM